MTSKNSVDTIIYEILKEIPDRDTICALDPCALLPIEFRCFAQCRGSKGRCYGNNAVRNLKCA